MTKPKDTVQSVKKENDELKKQLQAVTDALKALETRFERTERTSTNGAEQEKAIDFLSEEYDDINADRAANKLELSRLNTRLSEISERVNDMSDMLDELTRYSYQFNVKLVSIPEHSARRETAMETSKLCVSLFNEMGANVSLSDIDIAHRVQTRNSNDGPKPIVCKFTRRLAKESVMAKKYELCKVDPTEIDGLPVDSSLLNARLFDHLAPKQALLYNEAKRFKEQHEYEFCWVKNSVIFLRRTQGAHPIKISSSTDLERLSRLR